MKEIVNILSKRGTAVEVVVEHNYVRAIYTDGRGDRVYCSIQKYGEHKGMSGLLGTCVHKGKPHHVTIECDRQVWADIEAIQARLSDNRAAAEKRQASDAWSAAVAACPDGFLPARRLWSNGDLCSAEYQTQDGTKIVEPDTIPSQMGGAFYWLPEADVMAQRQAEENRGAGAAERHNADANAYGAALKKAKDTGTPAPVRTWMEDCPSEDCSTDAVTEWVLPDGSRKLTRQHTW